MSIAYLPSGYAEDCSSTCISSCPTCSYKLNGTCFSFSKDEKTWEEAEDICRREGGHLASVNSELVYNFLLKTMKDVMKSEKDPQMWIGANDHKEEGSWNWTDCSEWGFEMWAGSQPNGGKEQQCARMDNHGGVGWYDVQCGNSNPFFCSQKICTETEEEGETDIASTPNNTLIGIIVGLSILVFILFGTTIFFGIKSRQTTNTGERAVEEVEEEVWSGQSIPQRLRPSAERKEECTEEGEEKRTEERYFYTPYTTGDYEEGQYVEG